MLHFLHVNNEYIKKSGESFTVTNKVHWNERTWERFVSPIMMAYDNSLRKDKYVLKEILQGVIGTETTTAFLNFLEEKRGFLSAKDIIKGKFDEEEVQKMKKYMLHKSLADLYLIVTKQKLTRREQDNVVCFLENINQDSGFGFLVRMDKDKKLKSDSVIFEKGQLWNNDRCLALLRKYNANSKAIRKLKGHGEKNVSNK